MTAPSCPVSYGQPIPGKRVFHRGDPWTRPSGLQDLINSIPTATDLRSALHALNLINNIIMRINRGEPVINNTHLASDPDTVLKGQDFNPYYQKTDWVLEGREYQTQKLHNPDNEGQYIEIKALKTVYFYNSNTDYRLNYYHEPGA